jgi:DNA mismatch repair protein MutS
MMQQYLKIKQQYKDYILFFRMGDFYEMFFDDAVTAARDLEITLTARDGGGGEKVPMCGVPHHAAESYIARLIEKGRRVAICEQMEDPRQAKGLVKREVTRIVTPGTVMEGQCLKENNNNYLVSLLVDQNGCGLAYTDISTGLFCITQFTGRNSFDESIDELMRLQPAELLVPRQKSKAVAGSLNGAVNMLLNAVEDDIFDYDRARDIIRHQFGRDWPESGADQLKFGLRAAGAILYYLQETQKRSLRQINKPRVYFTNYFMRIDAVSRRNLELTRSIRDGSRWGTLLWVLDFTSTAMGGRLLKSWIEQPLVNTTQINRRLDAVEEFVQNMFLREQIKEILKKVYDLERLAGRVAYGSANARDLLALSKSFDVLPELKKVLGHCKVRLITQIAKSLDDMSDINELLRAAIIDDPPVSIRDGGIIRDGYHPEVDRLRLASQDGRNWLAELEAEERQKTGIKSLKIRYNKVFGYYLEVTKANLDQVPDYYIRRQTLVNAERFITPRLKEYEDMIMGAEDRLIQLEFQLFCELRQKLTEQVDRIQEVAGRIAELDVLVSFAEAAERAGYVRPLVNNTRKIVIKEGRHPVVERVLEVGSFVPNDTLLDDDNRLVLITGPNMAGKSTYMRQVALIALMAQAGSFVPAARAEIGVVDMIFTRIGAADDLAGGRSTFMVEMSECRDIVNNATDTSLIIMDEVGRGTSTYDGISIARALVEYINASIGARTLFSTHYHELTDLDALPGVVNYTINIREINDEIIFLRKVLPGKVDRSYGIQVARLAGLPERILRRAKEILLEMESRGSTGRSAADYQVDSSDVKQGEAKTDMHCMQCRIKSLTDKLANLDTSRVTPLEALNLLVHWQEELK